MAPVSGSHWGYVSQRGLDRGSFATDQLVDRGLLEYLGCVDRGSVNDVTARIYETIRDHASRPALALSAAGDLQFCTTKRPGAAIRLPLRCRRERCVRRLGRSRTRESWNRRVARSS